MRQHGTRNSVLSAIYAAGDAMNDIKTNTTAAETTAPLTLNGLQVSKGATRPIAMRQVVDTNNRDGLAVFSFYNF